MHDAAPVPTTDAVDPKGPADVDAGDVSAPGEDEHGAAGAVVDRHLERHRFPARPNLQGPHLTGDRDRDPGSGLGDRHPAHMGEAVPEAANLDPFVLPFQAIPQ